MCVRVRLPDLPVAVECERRMDQESAKLAFITATKRIAEAAADNSDGTGDTGRKVDILNAFVELCQKAGSFILTECDLPAILLKYVGLLPDGDGVGERPPLARASGRSGEGGQ